MGECCQRSRQHTGRGLEDPPCTSIQGRRSPCGCDNILDGIKFRPETLEAMILPPSKSTRVNNNRERKMLEESAEMGHSYVNSIVHLICRQACPIRSE
jgi:hypothetical protein